MSQQFFGIEYKTHKEVCISVEDGLVSDTSECTGKQNSDVLIAPGLVDLQVNGYGGIDLNKVGLSNEDSHQLVKALFADGVTSFLPTIITNHPETTKQLIRDFIRVCHGNKRLGQLVGGIHLEGPFVSKIDGPRGAHPIEYVQAPDWDLFCRWQDAADGMIRIVTLSPEWPDSSNFIEKCVRSGVIVSIGHTAANSEQIRSAIKAGASLSTHLGNASHALLPRHHNYIWDQLSADELSATIIADGFHLPLALLKVLLKMKAEKSILVSDATCFTGMKPGVYKSHIGGLVELHEDGCLSVKDNKNLLAGSAKSLLSGIFHLVNKNVLTIGQAWDLASTHPNRFIDAKSRQGLKIGSPADIVLFQMTEKGIEVKQTIKDGVSVYSK